MNDRTNQGQVLRMHELRWMGVGRQGCCGNTNTETEWRSSGGLDRKSAKMEGWCVEAKTHLGEAQLKHYDLHRNNAWAPDKHPRQKVRATTLKCFNKQYCVMKSQYKQISILKLKEMSDKKLLSWLRVVGSLVQFAKRFKNYQMRGSEKFCHLSHIGGRLVKFNPKKKKNVIVNDI